MGKNTPETSIIIITLNEEENLPKLLESIKNQSYRNYEIIVSDAGSKDRTVEIAKNFKCRIVKGGLPARGRNNGARAAKGDFFIFLDSDVILTEGFLERALFKMKHEGIDLAAVSQEPRTNAVIGIVYHRFYNFWQKIMEKIDPHAVGTCVIIRKILFRKLGGFDETIKLAEDHALARKAFRNKAKFRVLDEKILVSVRRMKKEGSLILAGKFILAALHRIFLGEIRSNWFRYEFGHSKA